MNRVTCGGFGAHAWWEKNQRRCKKIGATNWCAHCHKEMTDGTGWVVNWNYSDDSLYPIDGPTFEHRVVGNECVKHFLTADQYPTYAKRIEEQ